MVGGLEHEPGRVCGVEFFPCPYYILLIGMRSCDDAPPQASAATTIAYYKDSDFPPFSDEFPLTKLEYIEYKRAFVGKEVDKQYISDGDLKAAGYTSWVNFTILFGMLNW